MTAKHLMIAIDWYGPYLSLEAARRAAKADDADGLYLCIGKCGARKPKRIQYIGIGKSIHTRLVETHRLQGAPPGWRPLDGVWATPPYLHNGSAPSLYALLSPHPDADRPKSFCLGNRAYDPRIVGLDTAACPAGASLYDVTRPGNSNHGHEFRDGPRGGGVIGPALSDGDRLAVIEFLKTQ